VGYNIDGQSHILLVACRDIACGEKLYCDYNGKEAFSTFPLANHKSWWPAVISHSSFPLANHKSYDPSNTNKVLHKEDQQTMELCRTMQQRGQCPPLLVVFDSREGYGHRDVEDIVIREACE